jgi:hypothetical protein
MSPPGRPKGEFLRPQAEGSPVSGLTDAPAGSTPAAGLAERLAQRARAFEQRLDSLTDLLDPGWHAASRMPALVATLPPGLARRRVMLRLYRRWCGPLPSLPDLDSAAGALGLLPREALQARLAALALHVRPGALRCCVERRARQALEAALGLAFTALHDAAQGGMPVTPAQAAWTPLQWACVGYADLAAARVWPQRSLRRLVRLALPVAWPVPRAAAQLPGHHGSVPAALQRLEPFFAGDR